MSGHTSLCQTGSRQTGSRQIKQHNIRPAQPADVSSLAAIDSLVNPSPWRPGQFEQACSEPCEAGESALVLEEGGTVCGFIVFSLVLDEACIHNVAVHPGQQGKGLGRSLVAAALERLQRENVRRCLLEVRESNVAARGLYQALHFQLDGVRKNYYATAGGRENALLMSRQL